MLFFVFYLFDKTPFSYTVENRFSLPTLYQMRALLGKSPSLHKKIKLFGFDDTTLGQMGKPDLTIEEWAILFKEIAKRKPKAIYVDKLFALNSLRESENTSAANILTSIKVPIITISFVTPRKLSFRKQLTMEGDTYKILSLYKDKFSLLKSPYLKLYPALGSYIYGPHYTLQPYFDHVGHALNADQGKAIPIIQTGAQTMIPHMVFVGPYALKAIHGELYAGKQHIPVDVQGRVVVDFFERKQFFQRNVRMLKLFEKIRNDKELNEVDEGDIVLILPSMFTGGTDFVRTPIGPMPGGYVIASLLNSLVREKWIQPTQWNTAALLLSCLLGVPIVILSGAWFWAYIFICLGCYISFAVALFSYYNVLINISVPMGAYTISLITFITFRNQVREKLAFFVRILKTENEELRSEIDHASQIAQVFTPGEPPKWPQLSVSAYHETLINASGDWYTFERSKSGKLYHILMCDITGHGVQAAIIVSTCKTTLSMLVHEHPEYLEDINFFERYIRVLNSTLCSQGKGKHVTTMIGISICLETNKIHHITAGHPPALRFSKMKAQSDYRLSTLKSQHNPLGFYETNNFVSHISDFVPGDVLVLYTDGVPMPRNSKLLIKKILELFDGKVYSDSAEDFFSFIKLLARKRGYDIVNDDVSLIVLKYEALANEGSKDLLRA
ncbi:MAG: SpoIIE family protein phosphatase [Bdellovibrionota bacterium]